MIVLPPATNTTYRPDIDGLRAIAVLSVVLFHSGISFFPGGYVGVDVFFVISGYLITSIIINDIDRHSFSLTGFYLRRIRRIIPALFVVLACSSFAAYLLFMPGEFVAFGKSLIAAIASVSNVLFFTEAGYFEGPAELKPLLHTWSLGVEEQFYLIFPLLVLLLTRIAGKWRMAVILLLALFSLGFSEWAIAKDPSAAFYLAHYRAWELALGGLMTQAPSLRAESRVARESMGILGMLLILTSVFTYSDSTRFPGMFAAVPALGAALIIYSGGAVFPTMTKRFLSTTPLVFIGLISYSLYLWHWPILVFLKYYLIIPSTTSQIALALLTIFLLASLSWRLVEQPFRKVRISPNATFSAFAVVSIVLIAVGTAVILANGLPGRVSQEAVAYAKGAKDIDRTVGKCQRQLASYVANPTASIEACTLGKASASPSFILWGDSHAGALVPALKKLAQEHHVSGLAATKNACPPLLGVTRLDQSSAHNCRAFNAAVFDLINKNGIANVVLAARWSLYWHGTENFGKRKKLALLGDGDTTPTDVAESRQVTLRAIKRTIAALEASGAKVWLVEQVPELGHSGPTIIARLAHVGASPERLSTSLEDHSLRQASFRQHLHMIRESYDLKTLDPADILCNAAVCRSTMNGRSLYRDDDHLSRFGSITIKNLFMPVVRYQKPASTELSKQ